MGINDVDAPDWLRAEYPFDSHWLNLKAGSMHYIDEGKGPPVVMLHGNPTWSFYYRNLIKAFAATHRCVVPDHIGMGFSDKPQSGYAYTLENRIDNVIELVEKLGLEKFHLIVHDWGGAIGMGLAEHYAQRAEKLVIMNTAAFRSKRIPFSIGVCKLPVMGEWIVRGFNGFAGPATKMAVTKPLAKPIQAGLVYPYNNWRNRIATHRFVQDIPLQSGHPSYQRLLEIENGLEQLKAKPMLLLWGMRDFCFDEVYLAEWQNRFPAAQTVKLESAGHYLIEDETEKCITTIRDFLA